jgi:hypothetical protein
MAMSREQIHKLIEEVEQEKLTRIYDFIMMLKEEDCIIEADNSPLTKEEKLALEKAEQDIARGDLVDWEDIQRELGL